MDLSNSFAKNRAEEVGYDLWDDFVIPPFFHELEYGKQKKPVRFVGGRGCGKTFLLRYLSHQTQFSLKRKKLDETAFRNIGLYYRADTQYLCTFTGADLTERKWRTLFEHSLCLAITDQLLGCLQLILNKPERLPNRGFLPTEINFTAVNDFDETLPVELDALHKEIKRRRNQLAMWVNNIDVSVTPKCFPLKAFVAVLVEQAQESLPILKDSLFNILIDEYENLLEYQQIFVNTLLKHSEPPVVFHIAMKKNGMPITKTMGSESIQEKDDFRTFEIEKSLLGDFPLFCAELFFFRLIQQKFPANRAPVDEKLLRDQNGVSKRFKDEKYRSKVISSIKKIFPSLSPKDVAAYVLSDPVLKVALADTIQKALHGTDTPLKPQDFVDPKYPDASIVCAALLHQKKKAQTVLEEFKKLKKKQRSDFVEGDWIHHYLYGVLLFLYLPLRRPCLIYSGFDSYLELANLNIRNFLELCHNASGKINNPDEVTVGEEDQALAARETSSSFVQEIKSAGDYGNSLHSMVMTLGQIFRLSQERPSQSEAEKTHFSVLRATLTHQQRKIIDEAVKWSVLIEGDETKVKNPRLETKEYQLNPIYSPYFGISYRKGRKVELSENHAKVLLSGDSAALDKLVKDFKKSWNIQPDSNLLLPLE